MKRRRSLTFASKMSGSHKTVHIYLKLCKSLKKHNGCIKGVLFNDSSEILISASEIGTCICGARDKKNYYILIVAT